MSRHLISRRRFLSLPLAVFLAQVGRRPAQGWAATSPPRKGAYTADVGILYGLLTFRLEGVLTEATDREAGRYHVTIAGRATVSPTRSSPAGSSETGAGCLWRGTRRS